MTRALNANSNSLILLDEFGRGTTEEDGMSILGGVLKYFLNSEKGCPHILVSTHFQQMITYLPETPLIECQQMTYTKEDGGIYFLYKLAKGIYIIFITKYEMWFFYLFPMLDSLIIKVGTKIIHQCHLRKSKIIFPTVSPNISYISLGSRRNASRCTCAE